MSAGKSSRLPIANRAVAYKEHAVNGPYGLVISKSPINRIVVSRILQDCGIKPAAMEVCAALALLQSSVPLLIVIDAGRDLAAFDTLFVNLETLGGGAPPTIFLKQDHEAGLPPYPFNGVTAMPVTVETFRPLIDNCLSSTPAVLQEA